MHVHILSWTYACDILNFNLRSAATFSYYILFFSGRRERNWSGCFVAKAMCKLTDHSQYNSMLTPKVKTHFSHFVYIIHSFPRRFVKSFKVESFWCMDCINKDAGLTLLCASWENVLKIYIENQLYHIWLFSPHFSWQRVTQHINGPRPFTFKSVANVSVAKSIIKWCSI